MAMGAGSQGLGDGGEHRRESASSRHPALIARLRGRTAPAIIGHRGATAYRPENTMAAFRRAVELGAAWVELDVHLTRDHELVVIHDARLERTTDGTGYVGHHTLADVRRLDAGSWFAPDFAGARVPTLAEVLEWARHQAITVDIEIKNGPCFYVGIEDAVVALVERSRMVEQVMVTSFDHRAAARVKALDGRIVMGLLYSARPADPVALARQLHADVLLPAWPYVVGEDVRAIHDAGLAVVTWTSSDPAVLKSLRAAGVDGVVTDHPDIALQEIGDGR